MVSDATFRRAEEQARAVDPARLSRSLDEMLQDMDDLATLVWPRVCAGGHIRV